MRPTPTTAQGWFDEGMHHLGMSQHADTNSEYRGDLEDAVAAFDRAVALEPKHVEALWQRGLALASLDQHEAALDSFVAASSLKPEDADLQLAVAQSLAKRDQAEPALAAFERALALRSDDEEAKWGRAEQLSRLGRDEAALAAWDEVLSAHDNRTITSAGRTVRVITGDFRRAQARLARAEVLARLARPEAVDSFIEAFRDGALSSEPLHAALRQHEVAVLAYERMIAAAPDDAPTWQRAGNAFIGARRSHQAIAAFNRAVELEPKNAHAWFGKAEAHAQAGQLEAAIEGHRKALELWPEFLGAAARLRVIEEELRRRPPPPPQKWRVMGHDTFAREDYLVGEFTTREAAEEALARKEALAAKTQDAALRDEYWVVKATD